MTPFPITAVLIRFSSSSVSESQPKNMSLLAVCSHHLLPVLSYGGPAVTTGSISVAPQWAKCCLKVIDSCGRKPAWLTGPHGCPQQQHQVTLSPNCMAYLPACLRACMCACLPVCLHAYLPSCLSVCLPSCLPACPTSKGTPTQPTIPSWKRFSTWSLKNMLALFVQDWP